MAHKGDGFESGWAFHFKAKEISDNQVEERLQRGEAKDSRSVWRPFQSSEKETSMERRAEPLERYFRGRNKRMEERGALSFPAWTTESLSEVINGNLDLGKSASLANLG